MGMECAVDDVCPGVSTRDGGRVVGKRTDVDARTLWVGPTLDAWRRMRKKETERLTLCFDPRARNSERKRNRFCSSCKSTNRRGRAWMGF